MIEDKISKILRVVDNGPPDPDNGTEYPLYMLAVDDSGDATIVSLLNSDEAFRDVVSQIPDYFECDGIENIGLPTGIFQVRIKINGNGPSYYGEYDSWLEFEEIKQYKFDDKCLIDFEDGTATQCPW